MPALPNGSSGLPLTINSISQITPQAPIPTIVYIETGILFFGVIALAIVSIYLFKRYDKKYKGSLKQTGK